MRRKRADMCGEAAPAIVGTNRLTVLKVLRSSVIFQILNAFAGLVVLPRVLHGLSIRRYGEWATLVAILSIGQLAQSGVGTELARRVATSHGLGDIPAIRLAVRQGVTILLAIGMALVLTTIIVARPVVNLVFTTVPRQDLPQLTLLLIGLVGLFSMGLVLSGYFSILIGLQRSDYSAWSGMASIVAGAIATLVGIRLGLGLWALFIADCIQFVVSWIGPFLGVRRLALQIPFALARIPLSVILGLIGMPAMLVMSSASDVFDSQVDKLVLTHGVGTKASAMFQVAASLIQSSRGVVLVPLGVMLTGTAELYRTDPSRLRRLEDLAGLSVQAIAALCTGGILLFAPAFIRTWLGAGYGEAAWSMRVLAIAALIGAWSAPWTFYAIGRGRYYYVVIASTVTLVVNALSTVLLTSRIGLDGALVGSLAGSAFGTATARLILRRWEQRHWLAPSMRATGAVSVLVVPILLAGVQFPASWLALIGLGIAYLAVAVMLLGLAGSLPIRLSFKGPGLPRFEWRSLE